MTTRTLKTSDSKGRESEWSWEETPEVLEALANLRALEATHRAKHEDQSLV